MDMIFAMPALDPVLTHAAAASIAAVLLIGGIEKLREPILFADALANYRLIPTAAVPAMARLLPAAELVAGAMLLPLGSRGIGALLALSLLLLVTAAVAINVLRGRTRIDCGCGFQVHMPLSTGLLLRNLLLIGLTLAAAAPTLTRSTVWLDLVAIAFSTLFMLGSYFVANALLSQQTQLQDLRNSP